MQRLTLLTLALFPALTACATETVPNPVFEACTEYRSSVVTCLESAGYPADLVAYMTADDTFQCHATDADANQCLANSWAGVVQTGADTWTIDSDLCASVSSVDELFDASACAVPDPNLGTCESTKSAASACLGSAGFTATEIDEWVGWDCSSEDALAVPSVEWGCRTSFWTNAGCATREEVELLDDGVCWASAG